MVWLPNFRKWKNLSGGQKQRVAIARALYNSPKILVLDETTNNLDQNTEKEFYELINKKIEDMTKIIITHNLVNKELW